MGSAKGGYGGILKNIDCEQLIEYVRERPALWDASSHVFKNRNIKPQLWEEVGELLNLSGHVAQTKWKSLRDYYYRIERKKLENPSGTGTTEVENHKWPFFQAMHRMLKFIYKDPENKHTNMDFDLDEDEDGNFDPKMSANDEAQSSSSSVTANVQPEETEPTSPQQRQQIKNVDCEQLIEYVRERPALWDASCYVFQDRNKRRILWKEVGGFLNLSGNDAQNKWRNLRDYYRSQRKKLENPNETGTTEVENHKWPFFRAMHSMLNFMYSDPENRHTNIDFNLDEDSNPKMSASDEAQSTSSSVTANVQPEETEPTQQRLRWQMANSIVKNIDCEQLIEYVRERPALWDVSCHVFQDRNRKRLLWKEVGELLNVSANVAQNKWRNLRDYYRSQRKKLENPSETGTTEVENHIWPLFRAMHSMLNFIYMDPESRHTNIDFNLDEDSNPRMSASDEAQSSSLCLTANVQPEETEPTSHYCRMCKSAEKLKEECEAETLIITKNHDGTFQSFCTAQNMGDLFGEFLESEKKAEVQAETTTDSEPPRERKRKYSFDGNSVPIIFPGLFKRKKVTKLYEIDQRPASEFPLAPKRHLTCCSVEGCDSDYSLLSNGRLGISFHRVPTNERRAKVWTKILNINSTAPYSSLIICSKHFDETAFCGGLNRDSRRILTKYACPKKFVNESNDAPLEEIEEEPPTASAASTNGSVIEGEEAPMPSLEPIIEASAPMPLLEPMENPASRSTVATEEGPAKLKIDPVWQRLVDACQDHDITNYNMSGNKVDQIIERKKRAKGYLIRPSRQGFNDVDSSAERNVALNPSGTANITATNVLQLESNRMLRIRVVKPNNKTSVQSGLRAENMILTPSSSSFKQKCIKVEPADTY